MSFYLSLALGVQIVIGFKFFFDQFYCFESFFSLIRFSLLSLVDRCKTFIFKVFLKFTAVEWSSLVCARTFPFVKEMSLLNNFWQWCEIIDAGGRSWIFATIVYTMTQFRCPLAFCKLVKFCVYAFFVVYTTRCCGDRYCLRMPGDDVSVCKDCIYKDFSGQGFWWDAIRQIIVYATLYVRAVVSYKEVVKDGTVKMNRFLGDVIKSERLHRLMRLNESMRICPASMNSRPMEVSWKYPTGAIAVRYSCMDMPS